MLRRAREESEVANLGVRRYGEPLDRRPGDTSASAVTSARSSDLGDQGRAAKPISTTPALCSLARARASRRPDVGQSLGSRNPFGFCLAGGWGRSSPLNRTKTGTFLRAREPLDQRATPCDLHGGVHEDGDRYGRIGVRKLSRKRAPSSVAKVAGFLGERAARSGADATCGTALVRGARDGPASHELHAEQGGVRAWRKPEPQAFTLKFP